MHFVFPHNFVFWTSVSNHTKIKENYYNKIIETSKNWEVTKHFFGDFKCSFKELNDVTSVIQKDNSFLSSVIWKPIDEMFSESLFGGHMPTTSKLLDLWFNVYKPGEGQEIHDHFGGCIINSDATSMRSSYSGIYILHSEEPNKTLFYQSGPNPGAANMGGCHFNTDFINEGDVIIFPSSLLHCALPCIKERITIAFNIASTYKMNIDNVTVRK